jgi:hypothetical protein
MTGGAGYDKSEFDMSIDREDESRAIPGRIDKHLSVIPGRPEGPDPESRCKLSVSFWIPDSALRAAPE